MLLGVTRAARFRWWCITQYFTKGAANLCGMVEIINEEFSDEALKKEVEDRLMPRTEELPLYSTHEFNDKVGGGGGGEGGAVVVLYPSHNSLLSFFFISFYLAGNWSVHSRKCTVLVYSFLSSQSFS